jgi:hypothetical protein
METDRIRSGYHLLPHFYSNTNTKRILGFRYKTIFYSIQLKVYIVNSMYMNKILLLVHH